MEYVPDNYDMWLEHEKEQYRLEKIEEESELPFVDVPNDYGEHKELYADYKEE